MSLKIIQSKPLSLFSSKVIFSVILFFSVISLSACLSRDKLDKPNPPLRTTEALETSAVNQAATSEPAVVSSTSTPLTAETVLPERKPIASITQEGVSIKVTWVYADADRIGIEYQVKGFLLPDGYKTSCAVQYSSITDDTGRNVYEPFDRPFPMWPPDNLTFRCQRDPNGQDFTFTQNYYRELAGDVQSEQLTLEVRLGSFVIYTEKGDVMYQPQKGEPFIFNLVVPVTSGLTIKPNQTMSNNGITIRLDRVAVNPTLTDVFMCLFYDDNHEWYPDFTLEKGEDTFEVDLDNSTRTDVAHKYFPTYMSHFTPERCSRYSFNVPSPEIYQGGLTQNMIFTLHSMTINVLDAATQQDYYNALKTVQRVYPDLVFTVDIHDDDPQGYGYGFHVDQIPEGMDYATAQQIAEDAFKTAVPGPISFEIPTH